MTFEKLEQALPQLDREVFSHELTNDLAIPCDHFVPQQEIQQHGAWVNA